MSPDPTTVRIFLSEFEKGKQRGEDGWSRDLEELANERLAEAVETLKSLALRMSSICSALFYNAGILRGLKQSG